jgi:hypothetical protein
MKKIQKRTEVTGDLKNENEEKRSEKKWNENLFLTANKTLSYFRLLLHRH